MSEPHQSKPYEITPGKKLLDLYERFSRAITQDAHSQNGTNLEHEITALFTECFQYVKSRRPGKLPALQVEFLNQRQFDQLRSRLGVRSTRTTAFIEHLRGIVAVNVEALMRLGFESFVLNLAVNFFEELIHATAPLSDEVETKKATYEMTEDFLETKIPEEYKKSSYEKAANSSYGK